MLRAKKAKLVDNPGTTRTTPTMNCPLIVSNSNLSLYFLVYILCFTLEPFLTNSLYCKTSYQILLLPSLLLFIYGAILSPLSSYQPQCIQVYFVQESEPQPCTVVRIQSSNANKPVLPTTLLSTTGEQKTTLSNSFMQLLPLALK